MTPRTQENAEALRTVVNQAKRDLRQEVTDQIVEMLHSGTAPWQKPWKAGSLGMPFNPTTENAYRGGNAIHLMATGLQQGYEDPRWLTYKQAVQNGWQVRKGEKGTHIEYWEYPSPKAAEVDTTDRPADKPRDKDQRPIHRVYTVFNGQQIDGIPAYQPKQHPEWEVVQGAEQILQNSGATVRHDRDDRAFYDRLNDRIHLPPKAAFQSPADYYGTALHELGHWSGHPERLARQTLTESYRFGDTNYAKEELRAELTSVFLAAERGIPHNTARHAAYVDSWVKALKDDKNEIFRAARDANRAADFLLALEREKSVGKALEAVGAQRDGMDRPVAVGQQERTASQRASKQRSRSSDAASNDPSLADAKALSVRALGEQVRFYNARVDSGVYRGEIIGETQNHVVQKLTKESTVAHLKQLLGAIPGAGENVVVRYSNGKVLDVSPFEPKARAKEVAR